MVMVFVINDEAHAEVFRVFRSMDEALKELRRLVEVPWDQEPNRAPCTSWRTCHRTYEVVEYEESTTPWEELRRTQVVEISAAGVVWTAGFGPSPGGRD